MALTTKTNIGTKFSTVGEAYRTTVEDIPKANEPIIVVNGNGIRSGLLFGDGQTRLKDLELIGGGSGGEGLSITHTIADSEIRSSYSNPIELLPEIAIDRGYEIISIQCKYVFNGIKYTTNLDAEIKFPNSASLISIIDLAFADNRIEYLDINKVVLGGLPVVFQTREGNPNAGNGTIELTIEYKIVSLDEVDVIYMNFTDRSLSDGGTIENLSGLNSFIDQLVNIE